MYHTTSGGFNRLQCTLSAANDQGTPAHDKMQAGSACKSSQGPQQTRRLQTAANESCASRLQSQKGRRVLRHQIAACRCVGLRA